MTRLHLAAPTIVAIIGIAVVARVSSPLPADGYEQSSSPTPYSADHARVQSRAGEPEALPPTF
jgi:hypothetical protein